MRFPVICLLLATAAPCFAQTGQEVNEAKNIPAAIRNMRTNLISVQAEGSTKSEATQEGLTLIKATSASRKMPMPPTEWENKFFAAYKSGKLFYKTLQKPPQMRLTIINTQVFDGKDTYNQDNYTAEKKTSLASTPNSLPASAVKRSGNTANSVICALAYYVQNRPVEDLIESGRYRFVGVEKDAKYGDVYQFSGDSDSPGLAEARTSLSVRFWIAPQYGYIPIREETRYFATATPNKANINVNTVESVEQLDGFWFPTKLSTDAYWHDNEQKTLTNRTVTEFHNIKVNNVPESLFAPPLRTGDAVIDSTTNAYYRVGPSGEKIYKNISDKGDRQMWTGWLYMVSMSTLLVLIVGVYVRWKLRQSARLALSSLPRSV